MKEKIVDIEKQIEELKSGAGNVPVISSDGAIDPSQLAQFATKKELSQVESKLDQTINLVRSDVGQLSGNVDDLNKSQKL